MYLKKGLLYRNIVILLFIIVVSLPVHSQTNVDSIKKIWSNENLAPSKRFEAFKGYFDALISTKPNLILAASDQHLMLAKKVNSKKEILKAVRKKSIAYGALGSYREAEKMLDLEYKYCVEFKDINATAINFNNKAALCHQQENYSESVKYYLKSIKLLKSMKNREEDVALAILNIAYLFQVIEDFEQAEKYNMQALNIFTQLKLKDKYPHIWTIRSQLALEMGENKKAEQFAQKAFSLIKTTDALINLGECYYLFSKIALAKNQKIKAIEFARKSLEYSLATEAQGDIILAKLHLGKLLFTENLQEATAIGQEVLNMLNDDTSNKNKLDLYYLLYQCYKKQNKMELALLMLEKYNLYKNRLIKQQKDFSIIRQTIKQEFVDELDLSLKKNETVINALKQKQRNRLFLIIGVTALFLGFMYIFFRRRLIRSKQMQMQLLNEIEQIKSSKIESGVPLITKMFQLDKEKIEDKLNRKLNETDWKVLNILLEDPVISNQEIAKKSFLSVDGIGSSLRRMYDAFDIKETKYKKIALLHKVVGISSM